MPSCPAAAAPQGVYEWQMARAGYETLDDGDAVPPAELQRMMRAEVWPAGLGGLAR